MRMADGSRRVQWEGKPSESITPRGIGRILEELTPALAPFSKEGEAAQEAVRLLSRLPRNQLETLARGVRDMRDEDMHFLPQVSGMDWKSVISRALHIVSSPNDKESERLAA